MTVEIKQNLESRIKDCLVQYADSNNEANMQEGFFSALSLLDEVARAIDESKLKYEEHIQELIDRN